MMPKYTQRASTASSLAAIFSMLSMIISFQRFLLISIGDKRADERVGKSSNAELTGVRRQGSLADRRMMNLGAGRPGCLAVARPVERPVRRQVFGTSILKRAILLPSKVIPMVRIASHFEATSRR